MGTQNLPDTYKNIKGISVMLMFSAGLNIFWYFTTYQTMLPDIEALKFYDLTQDMETTLLMLEIYINSTLWLSIIQIAVALLACYKGSLYQLSKLFLGLGGLLLISNIALLVALPIMLFFDNSLGGSPLEFGTSYVWQFVFAVALPILFIMAVYQNMKKEEREIDHRRPYNPYDKI